MDKRETKVFYDKNQISFRLGDTVKVQLFPEHLGDPIPEPIIGMVVGTKSYMMLDLGKTKTLLKNYRSDRLEILL